MTPADLDPRLPMRVSYSGNHHPIVGVPLPVLDRLDHDQPRLAQLMAENGWGATVAVVSRIGATDFEARNPFPPGGVREDPATGSAAAHWAATSAPSAWSIPPADGSPCGRAGTSVGPGVLTVDIPGG